MRHADGDPVLIFDLDETILRVNSFPLWVRFLIAGRLPGVGAHRRALLSLRVLSQAIQRKLHRIDHDVLLRQLQRAWRDTSGRHSDMLLAAFQDALMREVRPSLRGLLQRVADGQADAVLATAAAADYANGLARTLGFRHVLATGGEHPTRNSGIQKRDRVLALLRDQDWDRRPRVLFTDHHDDLPLMRECDAVCWFGGSATRLDGIQIVPCLSLSRGELEAAFARLLAALQIDQAAARSDATVS